MANLRDLVGEYVARTAPVQRQVRDWGLMGSTRTEMDYGYTSVNMCSPKVVKIVDNVPILQKIDIITGNLDRPFTITGEYDDDNWRSVTEVVTCLERMSKELSRG